MFTFHLPKLVGLGVLGELGGAGVEGASVEGGVGGTVVEGVTSRAGALEAGQATRAEGGVASRAATRATNSSKVAFLSKATTTPNRGTLKVFRGAVTKEAPQVNNGIENPTALKMVTALAYF